MGGYGMTREEQIISMSVEYTESRRPICIGGQSYSEVTFQMNRNHAFEEGAKWADKTMLEKVATWLFENFYNNPHVNGIVSSDAFNNVDDMIDEFFKAMDE